jgi:hypothetical protein
MQWTELNTTHAPSPRGSASMFYDNASGQFLLFGGFSCWNQNACFNHNDTWSFLPSGTWVNITQGAPIPIARNQIAASYDPALDAPVIFGGHAGASFYNDTWAFVNDSWELVTDDSGPGDASGAGMVWDAATHQLLLYGGFLGVWNVSWTYFQGLYFLSGGTLGGPHPVIESFTAQPSSIPFGNSTTFTTVAVNGTGFSYAYTSLPPGCASADQAALPCTPTAPGDYTVYVTVNSTQGPSLTAQTSLTVGARPVASIVRFSASPSVVTLGNSTEVATEVANLSQASYTYTGLPGGCASEDAAEFACTPDQVGNFTLNVTVLGPSPVRLFDHTTLTVIPAPPPPPPGQHTHATNASVPVSSLDLILVGAAVGACGVAVAALAAVAWQRSLGRAGRELVRQIRAPPRGPGP